MRSRVEVDEWGRPVVDVAWTRHRVASAGPRPAGGGVVFTGADRRRRLRRPGGPRCSRRRDSPPSTARSRSPRACWYTTMKPSASRLNDLRRLGIRIAIDDFGTGYSSLSYLAEIPADVVKIDRSFVTDLAPQSGSRVLVKSIIELADSLGLDVVAEGVEEADQAEYLHDLGCPKLQGFLYAQPMASARAPTISPRWASSGRRTRSMRSRPRSRRSSRFAIHRNRRGPADAPPGPSTLPHDRRRALPVDGERVVPRVRVVPPDHDAPRSRRSRPTGTRTSPTERSECGSSRRRSRRSS